MIVWSLNWPCLNPFSSFLATADRTPPMELFNHKVVRNTLVQQPVAWLAQTKCNHGAMASWASWLIYRSDMVRGNQDSNSHSFFRLHNFSMHSNRPVALQSLGLVVLPSIAPTPFSSSSNRRMSSFNGKKLLVNFNAFFFPHQLAWMQTCSDI